MTPDEPSWYSEKPKPPKQWAEVGHEHDNIAVWVFFLLGWCAMLAVSSSLTMDRIKADKELSDRLQKVEAVLKIQPVPALAPVAVPEKETKPVQVPEQEKETKP